MRSRKYTAWRKNRRFGDVHGGRSRKKLADNIFKREHSLTPPGPDEKLPVVIAENPSRDFFFPLTGDEVVAALQSLPKEDHDGITHVWLRRVRKSDYARGEHPMAEFICGRGVRLIVLYPWPIDRKLPLGANKPEARLLREYSRWNPVLGRDGGQWVLKWDDAELRRFYVEHLLYSQVAHHVDWYRRHWSKANGRQVEDFASQYAVSMTHAAEYVLSRSGSDAEG